MRKGLLITVFFLAWIFNVHENIFASAKDKQPPVQFPSKVHFVENKNQWEDFIRYEADFRGGKLFLENNRFTYLFYHPDDMQSLHPHVGKQIDKVRLHAVKIHAVGGNEQPSLKAADPANYYHNYFIGNNASKWASDVRLFSSVTYQNIYPNIDLKFYSNLTDIKYDVIVYPQANASIIEFDYEGVDELSIRDGNLLMKLSVGTIVEQRPYAYQLIQGKEQEVVCRFELKKNTIRFRFPKGYNKSYPLIVDPTLVFSSFTGSSADNWGFTATYDAAGNLYSGGNVNLIGYPVNTGAFDTTYNGGNNAGNGWDCDMAIAKFNSNGTSLLYATYLGGSSNEQPQSLIVDGNDNLIIFGTSYSTNFPITAFAYQTVSNGNSDIVIAKLSPNGNMLLASTYIGGSGDDGLNTDPGFFTSGPLKYNYSDEARGEIIFDTNNDYIVGSCSQSGDFPTTPGVLQPSFNGGVQDGVVFKINSALTTLDWSSFLGGTNEDAVYDVTIDNTGDLYVAGGTNSTNFPTTPGVLHETFQGGDADGFLAHISNTGTALYAATYIGTSSYDQTYFVELDYNGNVYTTGQSEGAYPVTPGVYSNTNSKQFIHKMDAGLQTTFYSTVFGNGSVYPNISPTAFLVDSCENVYVAGWGRCLSFGAFTEGDVHGMPVTSNAFQSTTDGCDFYFFVLNHDAISLLYATYFGGSFSAEHVDGGTSRFNKNGTIYESVCAGCGGQSDFPTTPGVVSNTNNSFNCNNGVIKMDFNLSTTVSIISTSSSTAGCAPFTVSFQNSSLNANSFVWDFDDGSAPDASFAPTHTYNDSGVYHVMLVAINPSSCNQNDTSYVTIVVSSGDPALAAFTLLQNSPCDSLVATQFTGSGGNFYAWDFGDGYTTSGMNASHYYADTGMYFITFIVKDTICTANADTLALPVVYHPLVHASVTTSGNIIGCAPLGVTFNSSTTSENHFWNFMDGSPPDTSMNPTHVFTAAGTYNAMFVVDDSRSCNIADTAYVLITVLPFTLLNAAFNVTTNPSCDTLSTTANFNGTGGNIYHWYFGDGNQSYGLNAVHYYAHKGSYNLMLIAEDTVCDQLDTAVQVITFHPNVYARINTLSSATGCAPQTVYLSNAFPGNGTYIWYLGDGTVSTDPAIQHQYNDSGTYRIQLIIYDTASCNLSDTAAFILHVFANPIAGFTYDQHSSYFINQDIRFYNRSLNTAFYNWNFGDGTISGDSLVVHQFVAGGTHDVCLYATSQNDCVDSSCARLDILESELIYVPNVFTPNGDGNNDEFRIYCTGLTEVDVMIFNRWGVKLFEYNTLNGSWDGNFKGYPVTEDIYVWRLKAKGMVNHDIEKVGRVTLLR